MTYEENLFVRITYNLPKESTKKLTITTIIKLTPSTDTHYRQPDKLPTNYYFWSEKSLKQLYELIIPVNNPPKNNSNQQDL